MIRWFKLSSSLFKILIFGSFILPFSNSDSYLTPFCTVSWNHFLVGVSRATDSNFPRFSSLMETSDEMISTIEVQSDLKIGGCTSSLILCYDSINRNNMEFTHSSSLSFDSEYGIRRDKFLEVPQLVWGLNNQKIAFARACLTARMLNRTLLMPSLSASLFYKELDRLQPISFDKVFQFERFNSLCNGFVQLGHYSFLRNLTGICDLPKGSGRKWMVERDLDQLRQYGKDPYDGYEVIRIVGKNPFLWHDHWPVKDYGRVFECLVLVEEIEREASKVVSKIREVGREMRGHTKSAQSGIDSDGSSLQAVPYVAVHMRIEIDWMIHCRKLEQRSKISQICSSKEEIMERVGNIVGLKHLQLFILRWLIVFLKILLYSLVGRMV
ncbi:hypothetical protein GH714_010056 [Hevea brasiliensis]|uniref:O-fucosyltransferase family protein n=1 Tax=Hevea brasiliensis TaxID=3981 RepID=A0A6A6LRJ9_HEVBR|nr:hypothetical protein GH714_010056 [Hevea brasiliensis]